MAAPYEVADPSDWAGTPLAALESLDHSLRCQVCKEFLNSPMITTCSHTFCSLCIRRCLSADSKCPLCRAPDQPTQLRKNTAMEEVVKAFLGTRQDLLKFGRESAEQSKDASRKSRREGRKKRRVDDANMETNGDMPSRKTRATNRRDRSDLKETPVVISDSDAEVEHSDSASDDLTFDDGLVACPICQRRMPEERVFGHLETHNDTKQVSSRSQPTGFVQTPSLAPGKNISKPLPGLNYSMLSESALRKRIQSLDIPAFGNKMILQRRHAEWVNIWNANCDSTRPRPRRELLRDLDNWEKNQNRPQQAVTPGAVMDKEFDGRAWASSHGSDFQDLIARARAGRKAPQAANESEAKGGSETKHEGEPGIDDEDGDALLPEDVDKRTPEEARLKHFDEIHDTEQSNQI